MPVIKGPDCVGEEMRRFKAGDMHSGKGGKVVTDQKQAQAISLSACGEGKYAETLKSMGYSEETAKAITQMFGESFVKEAKKSSSAPQI
jgi:Holliday junction resolvasome RuvABC DNA-binding subunit